MAATMARAIGFNKRGGAQAAEATRLGHGAAMAHAQTYHTFASCLVRADGSGYVEVRQNDVTIHTFTFEKE